MSYLRRGFLAHLCQSHADGPIPGPELGGDVAQAQALRLHADDAVTVDDAARTAKLFTRPRAGVLRSSQWPVPKTVLQLAPY